MISGLKASVGSYEIGSINLSDDIRLVQSILTRLSSSMSNPSINPNGIDGKIARVASQSGTVTAISNFQSQVVRMSRPDSRIDVGGMTWKTLLANDNGGSPGEDTGGQPGSGPMKGMVTLTVRHFGRVPTGTTGTSSNCNSRLESKFTLSGGGASGTFNGSIYPDDMNRFGRIKDGIYPLHIGFHHGGGANKQTQKDLKVKYSGVRPGLLVNMRNTVPVISNNAGKVTSGGINVHNGNSAGPRGSEGCLTIQRSEWSKFINKFISGFPNIDSWHEQYKNTGKKIGRLIVKS